MKEARELLLKHLYLQGGDGLGISDGRVYNACLDAIMEALTIHCVSNWVVVLSNEQPEIMTDVMVKYKDGRKEVAFFDGDKRFYIEKDDRDVTECVVEWHKLP